MLNFYQYNSNAKVVQYKFEMSSTPKSFLVYIRHTTFIKELNE